MNHDTQFISDEFRLRVHMAAATLRARGETASIRLVRSEMGGGSPNWIASVLREKRTSPPESDRAEAPEIAAARLLAPGLFERIRATTEAEFSERLAEERLNVEEAQARLREQAFAVQDIETENRVLTSRVGELGRQVADQLEIIAALKTIAEDLRELQVNQRAFEQRVTEAFHVASEERRQENEMNGQQIAVIQSSVRQLIAQQNNMEAGLLAAVRSGFDHMHERISSATIEKAIADRKIARGLDQGLRRIALLQQINRERR